MITHSRTRVRFSDCDPLGVAHHTFVLAACDDNRMAVIAQHPTIPPLPIVSLTVRYRTPLRPGQTVEVVGEHSLGESTVTGHYTLTASGAEAATVVAELAVNAESIQAVREAL